MRASAILPAWACILRGYRPFLSVEITKQCPLRCPGCYAFDSAHLGNGQTMRELSEWQGGELVGKTLALIRACRPLHVSFVGGEPLLRHRELNEVIPQLNTRGIEVQIVTSAVRPIPEEWARIPNLHLVVSVDGLTSDHDARRFPATYERILKNIQGHRVIIHCTVLPQFLDDPGYLEEFVSLWSAQASARKIWFSLFTPQREDASRQRLNPEQRRKAIHEIARLRTGYPKVHAPDILLDGMRTPPKSPAECLFAQITQCVAADLDTPVRPCQIGGQPECSECGCIAAAGFAGLANYRIGGLLKVGHLFALSQKIGQLGARSSRRQVLH